MDAKLIRKAAISAVSGLVALALLFGCAAQENAAPGSGSDPAPGAINNASANPAPAEPVINGTVCEDGSIRLDYLENALSAEIIDGKVYSSELAKESVATEYGPIDPVSLCVRDLCSGELLASRTFGDARTTYITVYEDGSVGVESTGDVLYYEYYRDLSAEAEIRYESEHDGSFSPPFFYKDRSLYIESGTLYSKDLKTLEKTAIVSGLKDAFYVAGCNESFAYVYSYSEGGPSITRVRCSTGKYRRFANVEPPFAVFSDGGFYYCKEGSGTFEVKDEGSRFFLDRGLDGETLHAVSGGYALTLQEEPAGQGPGTVRAYSLPGGELMYDSKKCGFAAECVSLRPECVTDSGEYLLISCITAEGEQPSRCYYLVKTAGWQPIEKNIYALLDPKGYAKALGEKYYVEVLCEEEVTSYPDGEYTIEMAKDKEAQARSLEILSETLAKFPEGFFAQYNVDHFIEYEPTGIVFYICGAIHGPDYGTSTIAALTTPDYKYTFKEHIAFDVGWVDILETDIAHELLHAIEDKLYFIDPGYEQAMEEWDDMLPSGVYYNNGYRGDNGRDYRSRRYTVDQPVDGNAFFIDSYAQTFPHEDRARIFETMFTASDDEPDKKALKAMGFEGIRAKAQFLSDLLRRNFTTVQNAESVHWEKCLK